MQTASTGLRHPSFTFGGRCRKAMLGVWHWCCVSNMAHLNFVCGFIGPLKWRQNGWSRLWHWTMEDSSRLSGRRAAFCAAWPSIAHLDVPVTCPAKHGIPPSDLSPSYNRTGWLGVKTTTTKRVTYLLTPSDLHWSSVPWFETWLSYYAAYLGERFTVAPQHVVTGMSCTSSPNTITSGDTDWQHHQTEAVSCIVV